MAQCVRWQTCHLPGRQSPSDAPPINPNHPTFIMLTSAQTQTRWTTALTQKVRRTCAIVFYAPSPYVAISINKYPCIYLYTQATHIETLTPSPTHVKLLLQCAHLPPFPLPAAKPRTTDTPHTAREHYRAHRAEHHVQTPHQSHRNCIERTRPHS